MSGTNSGYFRRLMHRLTSDVGELDADDLSQQVQESGARRACDCGSGEEVTVVGRLRTVEHCPKDATATLEAELFDGTDGVTLIWMGRRRIPGIEPGRTIKARGRLADRNGRKALYNPYYELQTPADA
ncbi:MULTISPECIES: OB-fold nucleic acid binding domain-containing protein [Sciscionella]|uniref:OB-fold nucleic acid binding domain-containing protein n=1 Tax=Sciscionella TaxID=596495 RepID=UPI00037C86F9|nr:MULTISPECIES: OB-fold nucleic acid binding domain-containing protein [Sciscionella]